MLNDVTFVEAARALASRMLTEGSKTPASRIAYGFRLALAREPAARELAVLRDALDAALTEYKRHEGRAQALLRNGESPVNPKLDKSELAAWTTVASMILNLDETMTKQWYHRPTLSNTAAFLPAVGAGIGTRARVTAAGDAGALPDSRISSQSEVIYLHQSGAPSQLDLFDHCRR